MTLPVLHIRVRPDVQGLRAQRSGHRPCRPIDYSFMPGGRWRLLLTRDFTMASVTVVFVSSPHEPSGFCFRVIQGIDLSTTTCVTGDSKFEKTSSRLAFEFRQYP